MKAETCGCIAALKCTDFLVFATVSFRSRQKSLGSFVGQIPIVVIILMGHSYGGMVITGVADRVPDRIRRLVYVDAFVPNNGETVISLGASRGTWLNDMIKGDYIVPPWVKPNRPPPKDVPQPLKTFTEPIVLKNKAGFKVPATYILAVEAGKEARDDDSWPQAQRAKERGWPVERLTADHNAQWSAPEALAAMLASVR